MVFPAALYLPSHFVLIELSECQHPVPLGQTLHHRHLQVTSLSLLFRDMCLLAELLQCRSESLDCMRISALPDICRALFPLRARPQAQKRAAMAWRCHGTTNDELVDKLSGPARSSYTFSGGS